MTEPALYGNDLFGEPIATASRGKLADDFLIPPFTVLNAREGWWQDRKRAWIAMGIKSEIGRGNNALGLSEGCESYRKATGEYAKFASCRPHQGRDVRPGRDGGQYGGGDAWIASGDATGTSVFDPVLCELCYRWFCPDGGQIVDPFAGGSVRGIVAHALGRRYWGCDLRPEQIAANEQQAAAICQDDPPIWVCGDSIETLDGAPNADMVFSCPPYGNLEQYSDDPRDLSTMEYHTFIANYKRIIRRCFNRLRQDRFAAFVVGEFRDKRGNYQNFVGDTIVAFKECGFEYYNEAILVTCVGSLPVRITKQFQASRKLGKTHQNVLVFVKGDGKMATKAHKEHS